MWGHGRWPGRWHAIFVLTFIFLDTGMPSCQAMLGVLGQFD